MENCPKCGWQLSWFSGNEGIPEGAYCPNCNDAIYNEEGKVICQLV